MYTAKEKASAVISEYLAGSSLTPKERTDMRDSIALLLKQQDRDTRHACADAVITLDGTGNGPPFGCTEMVSKDAAHAACMNGTAV